ncbi:hypothetical protein SAMN05421788_101938 [Filimonas lacunae]|uniref:Uncharacterized protein n=1 Tax=Filimonas lacunae TaxID=477680 RepID=A0A173MPD8_9BACT|nr:hypothetical protein [Filimonas lacunae]BAV09504.1 hypothetical protein FLA_5553 [Filimonas lacunae]SIS74346.1 hypothetical protein SAMN05421788_101938 [Filimonas lacunae]
MTANWNSIVISISLLLAVWLLWKEYRRPARMWLAARLLATLLSVIAIALLAIPLSFTSKHYQPHHEVILLTAGYNKDSVQALQRQAAAPLPVYTLESYSAQSFTQPPLVHVAGYGLSSAQWQQLPAPAQLQLHTTAPSGITAVHWPSPLMQGQPLQVQGNYINNNKQPVQLQLYGEHTLLDSCTLAANSQHSFTLTTIPLHSGRAVYTLYEVAGDDTLSRNAVPVETTVPASFGVLVLASSPGFENRFLIDWLSNNGYAVAARTTISKNKFQYFYANRQKSNLDQLNASLLAQFAVLLCDATTLNTLSSSEQAAIREQVATKGMGIVLTADSMRLPGLYNNSGLRATMPSTALQATSVNIPGNSHVTTFPPAPLLYIQPHTTIQPVIRDAQQHLLAATALYGMGHLVAHTFTNSYSLQLAGNKEAYAALWTTLLQQAVCPSLAGEQWQTQTDIPIVNEPIDIQLITTDTSLPKGQINESFVSMKQDALLPFQWQGRYWPTHAGWQAGVTTTGNTWWWYAYDALQWQGIQATRRIHDTQQFAKTLAQANNTGIIQASIITVSPLYAWLVLILCLGFLWWESKHGIQAEKNGDRSKSQL